MALIERVLDRRPCATIDDYVGRGGGDGLAAAQRMSPEEIIGEVEAAGLRGRGGAGFPTGVKWRTVASAAAAQTVPVVVNAAEGEPSTFKDRELIRVNPFKIIEGALIAAAAMRTSLVVIAMKGTFGPELQRMREALVAVRRAGWSAGIEVRLVEGPSEYLFGEETGLLEVIDGRRPFPRIAPPYLRGADAAYAGDDAPALVDNVETLANVPGIVALGAAWFRSVGTDESPGTLVCTMTGHCRQHAVGEVPMGTPLREAIELIGGGPVEGRRLIGAMSGVANPIVPEELLDTPLTYEAMRAIGSGLGAGGFYVCDDETDVAAVVAGASRFLAVESCGQCEPCKRDGLAIASRLDALCRGEATEHDLDEVAAFAGTVADGARCFLATQQQRVVASALQLFPDLFRAHLDGTLPPIDVEPVVPVGDLVAGHAVLELRHLEKQPDWSYDDVDSGKWPAAALGSESVEAEHGRGGTADVTGTIATPGTEPPDPLQPLLDLQDAIRGALDRTAGAGARSSAAVEDLRALLTLHDDVTQRIVHPMAARVAEAPGDEATWRAEHDEARATRLLDAFDRGHRDGTAGAEAVDAAVAGVRRALDGDEAAIVAMLRDRLPASDLRDLGDALHEALLSHQGAPPGG